MIIMDFLYLEVIPWVLRFVMVGLGLTLTLDNHIALCCRHAGNRNGFYRNGAPYTHE